MVINESNAGSSKIIYVGLHMDGQDKEQNLQIKNFFASLNKPGLNYMSKLFVCINEFYKRLLLITVTTIYFYIFCPAVFGEIRLSRIHCCFPLFFI